MKMDLQKNKRQLKLKMHQLKMMKLPQRKIQLLKMKLPQKRIQLL